MASTDSRPTWEDIELSESYLVSSMYLQAASLAASVLEFLAGNDPTNKGSYDLMESAGTVLVQSLKELGRTSEILYEVKVGHVIAIPVEVIPIGSCLQITEDFSSDAQKFLEEYLGKWGLVDGENYVLDAAEKYVDQTESRNGHFTSSFEKYLEVVYIYLHALTEKNLEDADPAIPWVEKAALPEGRRQIVQRQASSMNNGMRDLWQLAFSYQVNPLAAVQPLPHGGAKGLSFAPHWQCWDEVRLLR